MDLFFDNPDDPPVPPDEVKIRSLRVTPHEDGRRVAVDFEITPFEEKPNLEMVVTNSEGQAVATFSVLEAIENKMTFTLHLKESNPGGKYTLSMAVFYTNLSALEDEETMIKDILLEEPTVVTEDQVTFSIKK